MLFLVVGIVLLIVGVPLIAIGKIVRTERGPDHWDNTKAWGLAATIFGAIAVIFGALVPSAVAWHHQIANVERLQQSCRVEQINERKADELIAEFRQVLVEQYPLFEQELIESISDTGDVLAFFVKYPELRTVEALSQYADAVSALRSAVFAQQTKREHALTDIRIRQQNPWYFQAVIPDYEGRGCAEDG